MHFEGVWDGFVYIPAVAPGEEGAWRPRLFDTFVESLDVQAVLMLNQLVVNRLQGAYYPPPVHIQLMPEVAHIQAMAWELVGILANNQDYVELLVEQHLAEEDPLPQQIPDPVPPPAASPPPPVPQAPQPADIESDPEEDPSEDLQEEEEVAEVPTPVM